MLQVFDKMASLSGFSKDNCDEFFAQATDLTAGELGAILGYLLGRLDSRDAAAMIAALRAIHPQHHLALADGRTTVNLVGTGGGPSTFNITTTAAFVVAAAGAVVVKTGSGACRSKSGFTDVAAKLGALKLSMPWEMIEAIADEVGIVFVPLTHYAPILGTFEQILTPSVHRNAAAYLNKIGPLLSPVKVEYQVIGANSRSCLEMLAGACRMLGDAPATLVSADDGLDEVSSSGNTTVIHLNAAGGRKDETIDPRALGIQPPAGDALQGYEPTAAAECCERILGGKGSTAQTEIVALNAAVVLAALGLFADLAAAFQASLHIIQRGEALRKLHHLRQRVWKCATR
jgi:anthranilate phosphoribosyltransferase